MASNAEVEFAQPAPRKSGLSAKVDGFCKFLYNPETKEVIGRTGPSWGKIGLFYLIFYSCLAGFFACMLAIFFQTVDDNHPKYWNYDSLLKNNPGMGFQPMPDYESTLIRFYSGKKSSYKVYTDYIQAYLMQYENEYRSTTQDTSNMITCDPNRPATSSEKDICTFELTNLGPCIARQEFGYHKGEPCVLLKLNKVYGWEPFNGTDVFVECHGENPADKDMIGPLQYYPNTPKKPNHGWIEAKYFPFLSQQNYQSPVVMVKFMKPEPGMLIMIECRAHNNNIKYNRMNHQGSVRFEMLVD